MYTLVYFFPGHTVDYKIVIDYACRQWQWHAVVVNDTVLVNEFNHCRARIVLG